MDFKPKKKVTLREAIDRYGEIADSFGVKRSTVKYIKLLKSFYKIEALSRLSAMGFYIDTPEQLN